MLFLEETSKKNTELVEILRQREVDSRKAGNLKEANFLMRVKHVVMKGVAMEHGKNTQHICPYCEKPMEIKHGVYCQNCGQLVR